MPRYKVNMRFGTWGVGDVFESTDEFHAKLAAEGVLTELGLGDHTSVGPSAIDGNPVEVGLEPPAGEDLTQYLADKVSAEGELPLWPDGTSDG